MMPVAIMPDMKRFKLHFSYILEVVHSDYQPDKHICASLVTVYFFRNNK